MHMHGSSRTENYFVFPTTQKLIARQTHTPTLLTFLRKLTGKTTHTPNTLQWNQNPNPRKFHSQILHSFPSLSSPNVVVETLALFVSLHIHPMSLDASSGGDTPANGGGLSTARPSPSPSPSPSPAVNPAPSLTPLVAVASHQRLRLNPNKDHKPDSYDDLELDFSPAIFSSLEKYLPPNMLNVPRDDKVKFMREILLKYLPHGERNRVQRHREYRQKIISNYQPLNREIYSMHPSTFFLPQFLKAINDGTEESFRSIMTEPSPGVFTFEMFQPQFCELLLSEVENFEKWVNEAKFRIMRPNTMNKYGAVLDDFGLEAMLDKLMEGFVRPMATVFFPEVGGSTLDSHHGFIVEYGKDRDVDLGFHVDDSEVTLNVCLGKEFSGGELFFRGTRCDKHVNTGSHSEEIFDYTHVLGRAVLHRGRHRHGARATTSGHRINLLLWCRSSVFREMKKYQKDFSSWCGECLREKKERQRLSLAATKSELLWGEGEARA